MHVYIGSRELRAQDELRLQNRSFIHASCFTLRLTAHETLAQVLSHFPLLCYCRPLLQTLTCCPRIHLSTVKIHGRMVLLRNSTPPQVMSPEGSSSTGFWSIHKIKKMDWCHDWAESIATPPDSDLEDDRLRKMMASPQNIQEREEDEGQTRAYTLNEKA